MTQYKGKVIDEPDEWGYGRTYQNGEFVFEQKPDEEYFPEGYKGKIYNEEELKKSFNLKMPMAKSLLQIFEDNNEDKN